MQACHKAVHQRPDSECQQVTKMIAIDKAALHATHTAEWMLVQPHKLAIRREALHDPKSRHANGRHGEPTEDAANILQPADPLYRHQKHQSVSQEHDQTATGRRRRQRDARPNTECWLPLLWHLPQRQDFAQVWRQDCQGLRRQWDQLQQ